MHLVFERSKGRFKSGCNILALAWTPYYDEKQFRQALFDYHQRQLLNLNGAVGHSINFSNHHGGRVDRGGGASDRENNNAGGESNEEVNPSGQAAATAATRNNSRLAELRQRYNYLRSSQGQRRLLTNNHGNIDQESALARMESDYDANYGKMRDFGWLVIGNVGKMIGITLTSLVPPPLELPKKANQSNNNSSSGGDLIQFDDEIRNEQPTSHEIGGARPVLDYETLRPDRKAVRQNYNLRGHLEEIILVRWNELYQKLATVDSKGNVLIWCKINDKFTIQTPFYNRTKSVADFKWSNDGKTALICYTDSFILVGSSSGQRSWHSMLNLNDYHITCASWTPNDEQLLLGVSNGNMVVIDLPNNELTELVVDQTNIRAICWSSSEISLGSSQVDATNNESSGDDEHKDGKNLHDQAREQSRRNSYGKHNTVVNQRRLSRDCSVFSRYRFCSQGLNQQQQQQHQSSKPNEIGQPNMQGSAVRDILAIDFANNTIKLYENNLSDSKPITIHVNQESYIMQWSSDGKILAVAGFSIRTTAPTVGYLRCRYLNAIKFYSQRGELLYEHVMKYTRYPITAFTWAHDDTRLFVATGQRLHCAKVFFGAPKLSLLATSSFQRFTKLPDKGDILASVVANQFSESVLDWQSQNCPIDLRTNGRRGEIVHSTNQHHTTSCIVRNNCLVHQYRLPSKLLTKIDQMFATTIRQPYDENWSLNDVVWRVPSGGQRYYCTLMCYASEREVNLSEHQYRASSSDAAGLGDDHLHDQNKIFVLYVEFQGSLIPILRARRVGYLKPEFVIFDPDDGRPAQQKQGKVSDISRDDRATASASTSLQSDHLFAANSSLGLDDNCLDLHLVDGAGGQQLLDGLHSPLSDIEHYYNFDPTNNLSGATTTASDLVNQKRLAELTSGRSHHQEPLPVLQPAVHMMGCPPSDYYQRQPTGEPVVGRRPKAERRTTSTPSRRRKRESRNLSSALSESSEMIRIKSNIWGTEFKLINVANQMIKHRAVIGSVSYKASILHLQPRQIHLSLKDMSNYCCLCSKHHHRSQSRSGAAELRTNSKMVAAAEPTLLDLPNTPTHSESSSSRSKKSTTRRSKRSSESDKVVLEVGTSLRIVPAPDSLPSKRGFRDLPLRQHSDLHARRHRRQQSAQNSLRHEPNRMIERSASASRSSQHNYMMDLCEPSTSSSQKDDILTLSLGQGDQVRVEMSSIRSSNLEAFDIESERKERNNEHDEFLAMNKTLKSIQTITKMIVDLSSRADTDEFQRGHHSPDGATRASPNKVVKRREGDSPTLSANSYIPPQAPVHRPRRTSAAKQQHLYGDHFRAAPGPAGTTQSATTTPLRSTLRSTTNRASRSRERRSRAGGQILAAAAPAGPLPPPPLPVPIGRRISSSAKRFIDGSLRSLSLSSAAGYSMAPGGPSDHVEPEESEPLVSKPSGRWLTSSKLVAGGSGGLLGSAQSQPSSPMRSSSLASARSFRNQADAFLSSASSFKSQLIHRLKKNGAGEAIGSHRDHTRASKPSDGGIFESDFSESEPDSPDDEESFASTALGARRPIEAHISASVRDLREIRAPPSHVGQHRPSERMQRAKVGRRSETRRARRKSICPDGSCCCAKEFKLNNRPPVWNESSQVYQLDFGGRVTQESAKNLQIDCDGKLALQFGRVNRCTYTLDYRYPFNAVQAMAVALASLTQRLK